MCTNRSTKQNSKGEETKEKGKERVEEGWMKEKGGEPKHPEEVKCPFTKILVKLWTLGLLNRKDYKQNKTKQ